MIEKVKSMILNLCENKEWCWKEHIEAVVKYSKQLAKEVSANEEICEISAWLHDIKKLKGEHEGHHISGSEEAGEILSDLGYPEDKIKKVKECILTHSSDENYPPQSIEAKVLACADLLSHFDIFMEFAYYAYALNKDSIKEGKERLRKKYKKAMKKIILPEAKKIAQPKYEAIMLILGEEN